VVDNVTNDVLSSEVIKKEEGDQALRMLQAQEILEIYRLVNETVMESDKVLVVFDAVLARVWGG